MGMQPPAGHRPLPVGLGWGLRPLPRQGAVLGRMRPPQPRAAGRQPLALGNLWGSIKKVPLRK